MEEQAEPPGICLRFVNFVLKSLSFKPRPLTYPVIRIASAKSEGEVVEAGVGSMVAVEMQEKLEGVGVSMVDVAVKKKVVKKQPVEMDSGSTILRPSTPVMKSMPNINEKSHAFIQKRKESLRRGSSLQPPASK